MTSLSISRPQNKAIASRKGWRVIVDGIVSARILPGDSVILDLDESVHEVLIRDQVGMLSSQQVIIGCRSSTPIYYMARLVNPSRDIVDSGRFHAIVFEQCNESTAKSLNASPKSKIPKFTIFTYFGSVVLAMMGIFAISHSPSGSLSFNAGILMIAAAIWKSAQIIFAKIKLRKQSSQTSESKRL